MRSLIHSRLGLLAGVLALAFAMTCVPVTTSAHPAKAWLGVSLQALDSDLRDALDVTSGIRGVVVNSVFHHSPAERAGLRANDIIISADGDEIENYDDLIQIVDDHSPGETLRIEFVRGDETSSLNVELGDREDAPGFSFFSGDNMFFSRDDEGDENHHRIVIDLDDLKDGHWKDFLGDDFHIDVDEDEGRVEIILKDKDDDDTSGHVFSWRGNAPQYRSADRGGFLGVSTRVLGKQLGQYFGVQPGQGVLIEKVVEASPAEKAGFRAGDVIVRVAGDSVGDPAELMEVIREHKAGTKVDVDILRDKRKQTIKVTLGKVGDFGSLAPLHELAPRLHALSRIPEHGTLAPRTLRGEQRREALEQVRRQMSRVHKHAREARHEAHRVFDGAQSGLHRSSKELRLHNKRMGLDGLKELQELKELRHLNHRNLIEIQEFQQQEMEQLKEQLERVKEALRRVQLEDGR